VLHLRDILAGIRTRLQNFDNEDSCQVVEEIIVTVNKWKTLVKRYRNEEDPEQKDGNEEDQDF
jgi:hypothetical protein